MPRQELVVGNHRIKNLTRRRRRCIDMHVENLVQGAAGAAMRIARIRASRAGHDAGGGEIEAVRSGDRAGAGRSSRRVRGNRRIEDDRAVLAVADKVEVRLLVRSNEVNSSGVGAVGDIEHVVDGIVALMQRVVVDVLQIDLIGAAKLTIAGEPRDGRLQAAARR